MGNRRSLQSFFTPEKAEFLRSKGEKAAPFCVPVSTMSEQERLLCIGWAMSRIDHMEEQAVNASLVAIQLQQLQEKYDALRRKRAPWSHIRVSPIFALYDFWVGGYYDRKKRWLYLLPLPCIGIIIKFAPPSRTDYA